MRLTVKQMKILKIIIEGNGLTPEGKFIPVDLDELLERLDYAPSKQSVQFSIRALIKHGLLSKVGREKRRDRQRTLIIATNFGRQVMLPRGQGGTPPPMPEIAFQPLASRLPKAAPETPKTTLWESLPQDLITILS